MKLLKSLVKLLSNLAILLLLLSIVLCDNKSSEKEVPEPQGKLETWIPSPDIPPCKYPNTKRGLLEYLGTYFSPCHSLQQKVDHAAGSEEQDKIREATLDLIYIKNAGSLNLGQICDIWDYCSEWSYFNDPDQRDVFYPVSTTVKTRRNDCDDYALLQYAMLTSIGAKVRLNFDKNAIEGHAYAEICLADLSSSLINDYLNKRYELRGREVHTRIDQLGNRWLNLDWSADYPGGEYFNALEGYTLYPSINHCISK